MAFGDYNLVWDVQRAVEAEQYAIHLARFGHLVHSETTDGENLWYEEYTTALDRDAKFSCEYPLYGWYK